MPASARPDKDNPLPPADSTNASSRLRFRADLQDRRRARHFQQLRATRRDSSTPPAHCASLLRAQANQTLRTTKEKQIAMPRDKVLPATLHRSSREIVCHPGWPAQSRAVLIHFRAESDNRAKLKLDGPPAG